MKTVLMAGGKGTRISAAVPGIPKPMIKICHKPVLEWEIECLRKQGFTDIIITVSHLAEQIIRYFGDGSGISPVTGEPFGVNITYFIEKNPLGNAGGIFKLWQSGVLEEDFLLLIADALFQIDFNRFVQFHRKKGALATLFTHPNSHPYDSGLVIADEKSCIVTGWLTKEDRRPVYYKNRVNAGLHILSPEILRLSGIDPDTVGPGRKADLDRDILKPLVSSNSIYAYDSPEYVRDMGTPERFLQVCADFASGRVQAGNLSNPQKAVFLNMDVMITQKAEVLEKPDDFDIQEGVAQAIKRINNSGFLAVIFDSQSAELREKAADIHNKIETVLGWGGAYADAVYNCPCSLDAGGKDGGAGSVSDRSGEYSVNIEEMLVQAARDYHISLNDSWVLSSDEEDISTAMHAGCGTVCIKAGKQDGTVFRKSSTVSALSAAVEHILQS